MKIQTIIGLDEHLKGEPLLSDDLPKVQVLSWGYSAFTYFGIAFAIINYALLVVQLLFLEGYAPV